MLNSIRINDFRSFKDSGTIELAKINVFVGPNNAGKSTILSLIELILRSNHMRPAEVPLALEDYAAFSSFDSLLRRNWDPTSSRPRNFSATFSWGPDKSPSGNDKDKAIHTAKFHFAKKPSDGSAYVRKAEYSANSHKITVERPSPNTERYRVTSPRTLKSEHTFFNGVFPALIITDETKSKGSFQLAFNGRDFDIPLVILRPYRPVPRSAYLLGDPSMPEDDKLSITHLLGIWTNRSTGPDTRKRIIKNFETLGLAHNLRITQPRVRGPRVVEVQVATHNKRQLGTIADVGFGVSQILPLLAKDSTLNNGALVAYQPEVHLHPRAQARLADVFVESAQRGNASYIETHSEHLILRLQTLIAQGAIPAKEVKVFCVEHDAQHSQIRQMTFDQNGSPTSKWPKGFLDTGIELARELLSARSKNADQK